LKKPDALFFSIEKETAWRKSKTQEREYVVWDKNTHSRSGINNGNIVTPTVFL
jgi:hypothetical protein